MADFIKRQDVIKLLQEKYAEDINPQGDKAIDEVWFVLYGFFLNVLKAVPTACDVDKAVDKAYKAGYAAGSLAVTTEIKEKVLAEERERIINELNQLDVIGKNSLDYETIKYAIAIVKGGGIDD